MEEPNKQSPECERESPLKKLWDILMFRRLILPGLLKTLNLLALLFTIVMTAVYIFTKLLFAIPIVWMYVIALRVASELILLGYNFLIQRAQNKQ
jgi:hypothetical protein